MKQLTIAIVTDDKDYAEALSRALRYRTKAFQISIHTRAGFTEDWKKGGLAYRKSYDLILWDGPDGERIRGENLIWVCCREIAGEDDRGCKGRENLVYRYDCASDIYGKLLDVYERNRDGGGRSELSGRSAGGCAPGRKANARIVAFAGWQGGSGCTTVCRAVAQELARFFGKRVLWISLDEVENQVADLKRQGERDAERVDFLLYRILGEDGTLPDVDRFIARDGYGVGSLVPSLGRNPLPHLTQGEAARTLSALDGEGLFDAILIDGGTSCSEACAELLGRADRICLVHRRRDEGREKRYMNWLQNVLDENIKERTVIVGNGQETAEDDRPEDGCRQLALAERREDSQEILLEGEFGKNIHALTETIWYNEINNM